MPDPAEESQYLWRTHGGLYVQCDGRIGKLCSLRVSPYGRENGTPELAEVYELIPTNYGSRFGAVAPDDVRPGRRLHISYQRADWVTTSRILDTYRGTEVDRVLPGIPHVVYGAERAWLLPTGDPDSAVPLLAKGWQGLPERLDLPLTGSAALIRLDGLRLGPRAGLEWIERNAPGWLDRLDLLLTELHRDHPTVTVSDARFASDGMLRLRLSDVPTDGDGRVPEALEHTVMQATALLKRVCTECGDAAEPTLVVGDHEAYDVRSLCHVHAEQLGLTSEAALSAAAAPLARRLSDCELQVEPGWYPLLTDLDAQLSELSDYSVQSCTQHFGELVFRTDFPEFTDGPVLRRVRELVQSAERRAEETCEHCGAPGTRHDTPWIHVCCGTCAEARTHAFVAA